jgi:hypothetical protein
MVWWGLWAEEVPLPLILVDVLRVVDLAIVGVPKGGLMCDLLVERVCVKVSLLVVMTVESAVVVVPIAEAAGANVEETIEADKETRVEADGEAAGVKAEETTAEAEDNTEEIDVRGGGKRVLLIVSGGSEIGPDGKRLLSIELMAFSVVVREAVILDPVVVERLKLLRTWPLEGLAEVAVRAESAFHGAAKTLPVTKMTRMIRDNMMTSVKI